MRFAAGLMTPGQTSHHPVLKTYLPILVFGVLGVTVGGVFAMLNHLIGPKKPKRRDLGQPPPERALRVRASRSRR